MDIPDITKDHMNRTALFLAGALALLLLAPPALADFPVTYNGGSGVVATITAPYSSPPGANDFRCRPSARHPRPVVLLHGLGGNQTDNFSTISPLLANAGYCVFSLTYGVNPGARFPYDQVGGTQPLEKSGPVVAAFVSRVLKATGSKKVELVGHSEGTVMSRYFTRFLGGAAKVDKVVGLTPLWHGTTLGVADQLDVTGRALGLGPVLGATFDQQCGSCREFLQSSDFMARLNAGNPLLPGLTYTNIVTEYDELVVPYTSGIQPGPHTTNIVLQSLCSQDLTDHIGMAFDPNALRLVLNALDPGHAQPVVCRPYTPLGGL